MKKIFVNSLSNFVSRFGINIISFLTLPIFIKYFGDSQFSIFILINSIVESLVFFDFGVGTVLGKKSSEYSINQDKEKFTVYFNWTFWFTSILSFFFGLIIFLFSETFVGVLKVDETFAEVASLSFKTGAVYFILYSVLRMYQTVLESFEFFVFVNSVKVFQILSLILCVWLIRSTNLSFQQYLIINMAGNILPYIIYAYFFHSKYKIALSSKVSFKSLLASDFWRSSKDFFVIQVTSFLFTLADKFIISVILGATQVVFYSVVTKVSFIVRMVNNQTLSVINPLIIKAKESGDKKLIQRIVTEGGIYQFLFMLPLIVASACLMKSFIRLWIGGEYVNYSHWGVLALLIYLIAPFTAMAQRVMIFGGYENRVKKTTIWLVLINVLVSVIFTYYVGIGGVIIGSVVQSIIAVPIFRKYATELLGIEYSIISKDSIIAITLSLIICFFFFYFGMEDLISNWYRFIIVGGCVFLLLSVYPGYRIYQYRRLRVNK